MTLRSSQNALQGGTLGDLYRERERQSPGRERKVRISVDFSPGRVAYTIEDEGEGFDWRSLPDPSEPANLLKESGRGIILSRLSMDETIFSEKGNSVTIVKYAGGALQAAQSTAVSGRSHSSSSSGSPEL